MRDFTLHAYQQLLETLKAKQLPIYTFEEVCKNKPSGAYIVLRHDVDAKPENSLQTAKLEAALNIKATYYFRIVKQSNQPEIIREIAFMGHEIGYHYEDLSICNGNAEKAIRNFKENLNYFRQFYPVKTICMHGSPRSHFDNRNLWHIEKWELLASLISIFYYRIKSYILPIQGVAGMERNTIYAIKLKKRLLLPSLEKKFTLPLI
jgi:hypothetical protein